MTPPPPTPNPTPKADSGARAPGLIHISFGGPIRKISVNGKIIEFEMHPYCGPNILKRNGEPLKVQPTAFLHAASLWAQQGERVENGLCVWDHEPEPIIKKVGRKNFIVGHKPAKKGE